MITQLFARVLSLFRKNRLEAEFDEEIQVHIEMATEENLRRGMSPEEARYAARRSFGHAEQMKEVHRELRGLPVLETIAADVRFAFRSLCRQQGLTATIVATLALGIASCTVVFGVINAVLLKSLPYPDPEQLVFAIGTYGGQTSSISPPDFLDYRGCNHSLSEFAAMGSHLAPMTLTGGGTAQRVRVAAVSGNFFDVLRTRPRVGRTFMREDEAGRAFAVISHALWQKRFAGQQNVIGEVLHLDGRAFEVIGVMPADFRFPNRPDVWTLFPLREVRDRGAHQLLGIGRLRENVLLSAGQQELSEIAARLERTYSDTNKGFGIRLTPLQEELVGFVRPPLLMLLAAVGLLLFLACANVANLLLARGLTRNRELATRLALGAGRARLVRFLMSEAAMLAFAGGAGGTILASSITSFLAALPFDLIPGSPPIPGLSEAVVDWRVLAFALLISVLVTLLVGLLPALRAARVNTMDSLRSGAGMVGRYHRQLASKTLVIFEVTLSLTLLIGAGVVFRSLLNVTRVNPGFNPHQVLTLQVKAPASTEAKCNAYFVSLLDQVTRIPGIETAAVVSELPLSGYAQEWYFDIQHRPAASPTERPVASYRRISSDYFRTMQIRIVRGRVFTAQEAQQKAPVAVVDEQLTQMYFGGEDPLGRRIVLPASTASYEIIGIVGNVLHYALFQEALSGVGARAGAFPTLYTPDVTGSDMPSLIVRANSAAGAAGVTRPFRETLQRFDKDLPASDIQAYDEIISAGLLLPRVGTMLLGTFSAIGIVLAIMGLYGVVAFSTAARRSEIGIRVALGSSRWDVLRLVVFDGLRLSLWGTLLGLAGANGFTRLLRGMLIRVSPSDPGTFLIVSLLLGTATFCASYIPARRAAAIDPALTLRHD